MNTLKARFLFGTAMFAVFFGIISFDWVFQTDLGFGCLAVIAGGIGLYEFYTIAGKNGFLPFRISGIAIGSGLFIAYWLAIRNNSGADYHFLRQEVILASLFWLLILQVFTHGAKDAIKNISVTIFGILYVFFLLSFAITLRYLPHGICILVMVLLISKGGDIGGFLLGRKYGKRKLARFISPNKTVEGACFAFLFSIFIAVIFNLIPQIKVINLPLSILFGAVVGFSAMMGDLTESLLKRDVNVKDSSHLVPAFGGILDIIDCLLVSMPVAYYFLIVFQFG
ncbi:MAG: phosphatidate cytidylyltransferase [Candidatus Loosdrechtia sp.]|uniref:phosphatidate cytidylyltransferase n=1 Tax=Candidatus Loosdrechtia sp. TaxID=3101272 RepID=UPI003A5FB5BD|nr:MAG: phosphatidate cytidylyltransferase [Candidatus Jettenia sp. AMX2]